MSAITFARNFPALRPLFRGHLPVSLVSELRNFGGLAYIPGGFNDRYIRHAERDGGRIKMFSIYPPSFRVPLSEFRISAAGSLEIFSRLSAVFLGRHRRTDMYATEITTDRRGYARGTVRPRVRITFFPAAVILKKEEENGDTAKPPCSVVKTDSCAFSPSSTDSPQCLLIFSSYFRCLSSQYLLPPAPRITHN